MTVFRGDSSFVRKKRNLFMLYISDSRAQHLVRVASYFFPNDHVRKPKKNAVNTKKHGSKNCKMHIKNKLKEQLTMIKLA